MEKIKTLISVSVVLASGCSAVSVENAANSADSSANPTHLRYFGYYWVESKSYGSHLDEVIESSNIHWVEGVEGLKKCADSGVRCIVQVRWELFSGGGSVGGRRCPLRPDYKSHWDRSADIITPYANNVEAFYMIDEPYWNGVNRKDLDTAIETVKERFPRTPVMIVFAHPTLSPNLVIPERADWIGFDHYAPIDAVAKDLRLLKGKLHPHQRLFLVPQSFLNKAAPTDKDLAELNRQYYELATSEPLVIGLLNFGFWTPTQPKSVPLTFQVQREIGAMIRIESGRTIDSNRGGEPRR